jgi:hypothetical protein
VTSIHSRTGDDRVPVQVVFSLRVVISNQNQSCRRGLQLSPSWYFTKWRRSQCHAARSHSRVDSIRTIVICEQHQEEQDWPGQNLATSRSNPGASHVAPGPGEAVPVKPISHRLDPSVGHTQHVPTKSAPLEDWEDRLRRLTGRHCADQNNNKHLSDFCEFVRLLFRL